MREHEIAKEKLVVDSNNLGSFYKHVNRRLSCRSGVGALCNADGSVATTDSDKAELLNKYFCTICTKDDGVLQKFDKLVPDDIELNNIEFTPGTVEKVLRRHKKTSSCGPDGLPPVVLKKLAPDLAAPLSLLFNQLMLVDKIPDDWRNAVITPINKGGLASDVSNYRPVALTSAICKIMERIVVQNMLNFLRQHNLISRQQHGFLSGRSTSTNFLETLNDFTLSLKHKENIVAAYIDYAKAFDSVSQ